MNHRQWHPDGELATHRGCAAASNTPMILSQNTGTPVEQVVPAAASPMWFQLYPQPGGEYNRKTIEGAQAAGCRAIVITVDQTASYSDRSAHARNLTTAPSLTRPTAPPAAPLPDPPNSLAYRVPNARLFYDWQMMDDLRKIVKGKMICKGIATAEDALLCLEHGVDAIFISNHGGRSQDYGPSTLEILPEIADAIHGRVPIILDSGIRRGSDILKALALGANVVSCGRAPLWGLAYGALGVQRVLEILQTELVQAMAANGRPTLASIDKTLVRTEFL
jgi:4-hydroxymandelate oxidase